MPIHEDITLAALSFIRQDVFNDIVDEHEFVDVVYATERKWHFDGCEFHDATQNINELYARVISNLNPAQPASIKEAQIRIKDLTGMERSPTQVRNFMHRLGMKPRKVGRIPAKADHEQQKQFHDQKLLPCLTDAQAGKCAVFFVDAAHFVLAPFLGVLWSFTRLFVPAPAGRQRFNVLAALNALSHELITVTNETYIDADAVCSLLRKLAALNLGVPIFLILDNARYQHCAKVIALAAELQIQLLFLPPYSPNLNLIERLWKFVKKKSLYSKYYAHFPAFKSAILSCLDLTQTTYKSELDSLLTLNFQLFEKSQILTV